MFVLYFNDEPNTAFTAKQISILEVVERLN